MLNLDMFKLLRNVASDCGIDQKTTQYCINRLENEGYKFWSSVLPGFSKYLLRSIEAGYLLPKSDFTSIGWVGTLPIVFRGLIRQMFSYDAKTNKWVLIEDFDPCLLWQIRQFCEYLYKLQMPFSRHEQIAAIKKFKETDASLSEAIDADFLSSVKKIFEAIFPNTNVPESTPFEEYTAEAGPGTFSGCDSQWKGLQTNHWRDFASMHSFENDMFVVQPNGVTLSPGDRFDLTVKTPIGAKAYPWFVRKDVDYGYWPAYSKYKAYLTPRLSWCEPYPACDPTWSELLFVPKDSRGPRSIVREPFSKLRADSCYFSWLKNLLEETTDKRVNFVDQSINQSLAKSSSVDKRFATLDLKDASDRVRADVCEYVFSSSPVIQYFVKNRVRDVSLDVAYGVRKSDIPLEYRNKPLILLRMNKLAGMGSYLTFCTMSLLIYVTAVTSVYGYLPDSPPLDGILPKIYVYGDDVICPTEWAPIIIEGLEKVGLLVNTDKSFLRSHFRESCGGDYYMGQSVTPLRLKLTSCSLTYSSKTGRLSLCRNDKNGNPLTSQDWKAQRSQFYLALERHARELIKNGMIETAAYVYDRLESWLGPLPSGSGDHPYFCRYSNHPVSVEYDESGTSRKVKVWTCVPPVYKDVCDLDANPALARNFSRDHADDSTSPLKSIDWLFAKSVSFNNSEWSIPRRVTLVRRTVRAFALAG